MKIVKILENSSYTLHDEYIADFSEFIAQNPNLPVSISGKTLTFEEYIIGSISIGDLTIIINPRISNLTPNHYFEMELYNEGLLNDNLYLRGEALTLADFARLADSLQESGL